jgi:AraC-like DNA-binding protein
VNRKIEFGGMPVVLELKSVRNAGPFFHRDDLEILFVLEGEALVTQAGMDDNLREGEFCIIDAGVFHRIQRVGTGELKVVSMCFDLPYYEAMYPYIRGIGFMLRASGQGKVGSFICNVVRNYMIRMLMMRYHDVRTLGEILKGMADVMMSILFRWFNSSDYLKIPLSDLKEIDIERLFQIAGFVAKNYRRRDLSIKDVAAAANLSVSRVSHFWREYVHLSLQGAISMNRVNETARLLLDSDMPLSEISEHCGFSDEKYLYGSFKKTFKMTPNEYRQKSYMEHQSAGNFSFMNVKEEYRLIRSFSETYYTELDEFPFLRWHEDRTAAETNIFRLYGDIFKGKELEATNRVRGQEYGIFSMAPNIGLLRRGEKYFVNWEYVYGAIYWFNELELHIRVEIDYALMPPERWEFLIDEMQNEIIDRWGRSMADTVNWVILSHGLKECEESWIFAERLRLRKILCNVETLFIL